MNDISRRSLILGGLMAAASAGAFAAQPRRRIDHLRQASFQKLVPDAFQGWRREDGGGIIRPPEEGEAEREAGYYDHEISRIYAADDRLPVMLVMAYGGTQSDRLQVHRPEFCYPAAGFALGPARAVEIATAARRIPASFFTATRGDRREHILYWTRLGEYFPVTWLGQHWSRVRNSFDGVLPDGILVRMSVIGGEAEDALALLEGFAGALVEAVAPKQRAVLVGGDAA